MQEIKIKYITIFIYLTAIILANNSIAFFGETALFITAFFLIPLDLVTRDILHEFWQEDKLWRKMFLLIASGSFLSFLTNVDTLIIGIGSMSGFLSAGITNTFIYHLLRDRQRFVKMNTSNFFASIVDSTVFISIVFGFSLSTISIQSGIKFIGGLFWTIIYIYLRTKYYD